MQIIVAACQRRFPALFACHRLQTLREARRDRRRAGKLGGPGEDHFPGAERLREVVGGQADAPFGRSRPSSWRIGRFSQGSLRVSGGQTPSTRPPSTRRSTFCNLASNRP